MEGQAVTANLTADEVLVLQSLSVGLTVEMIAETIDSTVSDVAARIEAAQHKLQGKNELHAVANALRQELIR